VNHGVCLKRLEVGRPSIITHSLLHRLEFCDGDDSIASARAQLPTTSIPFCTVVGLFRGSRSGCGSVAVPVASSATVQRCEAGCVCRRGTAVVLSWDRGGTRRGAEISYRISIVHGLAALAGRQKVEWSGGEWSATQHSNGGCDSAILVRNQAAALALSEAEASFFAPSLPFPLRALPCLPPPLSHHPWPWPSPVLPVVPVLPGQAA